MRLNPTFLRSKVARRIFVLFICCALVPTTILAILSFTHVTRQLNEQSNRRLHQATKTVGMAIYERLMFLDTQMITVASDFNKGLGVTTQTPTKSLIKRLEQRFQAMAVFSKADGHRPIIGTIGNPPELTPAELEHINAGKTLILTQNRTDLPSRIFMIRSLNPQNPSAKILLGEIDAAYLSGLGEVNALPPMTELCLLDQSNNVVINSLPGRFSFPSGVGGRTDGSESREFEWKHQGDEYLASWWTIFLKIQFFVPNWTVVLSQSKAEVLAPMASFKRIFPLVVLTSLWVVLLLSIIQIRRNLVPLEKLKEGTLRIAKRDFDSRVAVTSGDEFEELAASFNAMADQLGKQFGALATIGEIDRAILSTLDTENIVDTVLTRMRHVFPCDVVGISLTDSTESNTARTYIGNGNPGKEKRVEVIEFEPAEVQEFRENPQYLLLNVGKNIPHYVRPLAKDGIRSFLVLPIFLKERLSGIITLGYIDSPQLSEEDLVQARQLADQVAVALSNIDLIEEQKRLESQLIQTQKMQAIGTLAGGIAHDFNNILYPIIGFTDMTMDDLPQDSLARSNLEEVLTAARRAKDLVGQILTFSRQGAQEKKPLKIQLVIKEVLKLLRASLPSTIQISQNIDNECGPIVADPTQIHQVMMNLCTNAYHAMRENGGTLGVILTEIDIDSSDSVSHLDLNPGPYVRLTVNDTGHGIDREVLERIFDPFFTTKEPGEGTGMGLSVVHGIIKSHDGKIMAESEPGHGTTFHVYFPLVEATTDAPGMESTEPIPGGEEHILFIDDEEQIVRMMQQMLERLGYHITALTSSVEALDVFREQPDRFDLVITDQTMPNMTGEQLAQELMGVRADIPIIICTGLNEVLTKEKAMALGILGYARKPVAQREMAVTIRRLIDEHHERGAMERILIVDDEAQIRTMLRQLLEGSGYDVVDAQNGKIAMELQREEPADLVIVDIIMPSKDGIETIRDLTRDFPEVKIIAMSGGGRIAPEEYLSMAKGLGAMRTLTKPIERDELLGAIKELLE